MPSGHTRTGEFMLSPYFLLGTTIVATIASYAAIPGLLWGLQQEAPLEYEALGSPTEAELFARRPSLAQWHFLWFVVSGQAYAATRGATRMHAVAAWLGYVGVALSMVGMLLCSPGR
jgi:hypothetical protein